MTTVLPQPETTAPAKAPRPRLRTWLALGVVGLAAFASAIVSGIAIAGDGDRRFAVIPLAAMVGVALAVLAFTRFSTFVLMLLVVRSSLDLVKLSGISAGNTETNTAAARGLDPASILSMLFIVAALFWLLAQYSSGRTLRGSPVRTAFIVFVLAGAVSVIEIGRAHV